MARLKTEKRVWGSRAKAEKEMVMELLKLSKFKLQLQAVISEVQDLRVRISIHNLPFSIFRSDVWMIDLRLITSDRVFQERERLAADQHHHGIEVFILMNWSILVLVLLDFLLIWYIVTFESKNRSRSRPKKNLTGKYKTCRPS